MKKTLSQTNKDLDLRRFGKDVYSKALGEGGSEEITYDDVIKYYTNGRYSKLDDIPEVSISIEYNQSTLDEDSAGNFAWGIEIAIGIVEPSNLLSVIEDLYNSGNTFIKLVVDDNGEVKSHTPIYRIHEATSNGFILESRDGSIRLTCEEVDGHTVLNYVYVDALICSI